MRKFIKTKLTLQTILASWVAILAVAYIAAATTIGTNISTSGSLSVTGTTTMNGVAYIWPSSDGTSGQFLTSNGSGTLSWGTANPSSGGGWTDSGATVYPTTMSDQFLIGTTTVAGLSQLTIEATSTASIPLTLRGRSGQTANLFQVQNVSGSNLLTVNSTGNVGIGTTSPRGVLHALTTGGSATLALSERGGLVDDTVATASRVLSTKTTNMADGFGSCVGFYIQDDAGVIEKLGCIGAQRAGADNTGALIFHTNVSGTPYERLRITSGGNVGIGEEAPGSTLSVSGGATIGASYDTTAAPSNGMIIEGKVGIGTTTPAVSLHVTASTANATTTVEFGKAGQNKGTCLKMYNGAGTVTYCTIAGTTFSCSTESCE